MRRALIPSVALLMVACLRIPLQAVEPDTLTLSCKGTQTNKIGPRIEPDVSITFIFNFATGRVSSSIDAFGELSTKILSASDVTIVFAGDSPKGKGGWGFGGAVDRVTGEMKAQSTIRRTDTGEAITITEYLMKCSPAQRVF